MRWLLVIGIFGSPSAAIASARPPAPSKVTDAIVMCAGAISPTGFDDAAFLKAGWRRTKSPKRRMIVFMPRTACAYP